MTDDPVLRPEAVAQIGRDADDWLADEDTLARLMRSHEALRAAHAQAVARLEHLESHSALGEEAMLRAMAERDQALVGWEKALLDRNEQAARAAALAAALERLVGAIDHYGLLSLSSRAAVVWNNEVYPAREAARQALGRGEAGSDA